MKARLQILLKYIHSYKYGYIIGFIALIATDIFMLLRPRVVGDSIDSLATKTPAHPMYWYIGIFLFLVVVENIFRLSWRLALISASRKIERDFMNDFFAHLLKLDPRFFDRTPTGDLMARATNDIASIRMLLGPGIMSLFDAVVVIGMTLFFMITLSPKLTLYSMLPMPFLAIIIRYLLRNVHNNYDIVQAQFSTISARAQESMSGIRVVKAHNREENEIKEFDSVTDDYVNKYMTLTKYESALEPTIRLVASVGVMITLFVGGKAVILKENTLGQLVQFFLYLMTLTWPVIAFGWSANLFERGMASLGRIKKVFDEQPTILAEEDKVASQFNDLNEKCETMQLNEQIDILKGTTNDTNGSFLGDIEFKDVSFKYASEGEYVLKDINLLIKKGTTLGIVGPMGSGKTSLINLIPRLYDPEMGEILIGGVNIKEIPLNMLRKHIGFVPQEPFLFSSNIKENINLGLETNPLDDEEVLGALELADVLDEVKKFPHGMNTMLGERGVRLSGGQKQRMTIARALARKTGIVILDDTLSSVDAQTEQNIIQNLKSFGSGRTNIIVSHRISSVKDSELIIVLVDGEITERGTHSELLGINGFYARLYKQQLLMQKIEKM